MRPQSAHEKKRTICVFSGQYFLFLSKKELEKVKHRTQYTEMRAQTQQTSLSHTQSTKSDKIVVFVINAVYMSNTQVAHSILVNFVYEKVGQFSCT